MPKPAFELAGIFRQHGETYRATHQLPLEQLRAMRAIEVCRTAALGGHAEQCSQCDYTRIYNSCRNRHCPKCQNAERANWLESRKAELLPVEYFHVVFTIPEELARLAFYNKEVVYGILFRAASETLLTIARDPKHLGAEIGFFAILHTCGQNLLHPPHVHCVVPGGGISPDQERWISCLPGFFLPVRVLSRLFRRLFLEALEDAFYRGKLSFFGETESLRDAMAFAALLTSQENREWVVYAKPPFGGARQALAYLGRYTHRAALSNERLLHVNSREVTFQWKDYRHKHKENSRVMTLDSDEFIRRFLIHILPPGLQRIRYYGFLANRYRREKLAFCRQLLATPATALLPDAAQGMAILLALTSQPPVRCPQCKKGVMVRLGFVPPYTWPAKPRDTS